MWKRTIRGIVYDGFGMCFWYTRHFSDMFPNAVAIAPENLLIGLRLFLNQSIRLIYDELKMKQIGLQSL